MPDTLRVLRALSDPTRLRLLAVLESEELSVNELQEITRMGQSRISTQLGQIQEAGLVTSRREGKRTFYKLHPSPEPTAGDLLAGALRGARELESFEADQSNLKRALSRRENVAQGYFDQVAGRFDRSYGPGRSWQAFGQLLLRLIPQLTIADLGSGEGLMSELLARGARKVIAVDNSERMVTFGASKARKNGIRNLEFRLGDLEDPPIDAASVDLAILSQALHHAADPLKALLGAYRILKPGGQIVILDLLEHPYEAARELYGDRWLGFSEAKLVDWLEQAGFRRTEVSVVAKEEAPPHFQTLLATAWKPLNPPKTETE